MMNSALRKLIFLVAISALACCGRHVVVEDDDEVSLPTRRRLEEEEGDDAEGDDGGEEVEQQGAKKLYLYSGNDAFPVIDYHTKKTHPTKKPVFLYTPYKYARIVEFYAPWCPHCQHFKPHYVEFAKQITTLAKDAGVRVKVYAVSCTAYPGICHDFQIRGYPQLRLFAAGSANVTAEAKYWKLHPFNILSDLGVEFNKPSLDVPSVAQPPAVKANDKKTGLRDGSGGKAVPQTHTKEDTFNDAYQSFHFALNNAIYMTNGPLNNSTRDAFQNWLLLLRRSMPPAWKIQSLVKELLDDFDNVATKEENLKAIVSKFKPDKIQWSASCSYTCGLWRLFHIMTIGVVEWNLMLRPGGVREMGVNTDEASLTLRNYIEKFFGCQACRENFLAAYDACSLDRCHRLRKDAWTLKDWSQLPLWLFESHNSVNVRLMKENAARGGRQTSSQDEVDVQFPPRKYCRKCWREDGGWDETIMYKYLRIEYWPEDKISTAYREELFGTTEQ